MSAYLMRVHNRVVELKGLLQRGIVPQNVAGAYIEDVDRLVQTVYTLRNSLANIMGRLDQATKKQAHPKAAYLQTVDDGIDKLLKGDFRSSSGGTEAPN